jgi:hypothetical protein
VFQRNNSAGLGANLARCSSLGTRRNERFGLDAGLDDENRLIGDGCDIDHEVARVPHGLDGQAFKCMLRTVPPV